MKARNSNVSTAQDVFDASVSTLLIFGQFPVIFLSLCILGSIAVINDSFSMSLYGAVVSGIASPLIAGLAVTRFKHSQKTAIVCLVVSLFFTLVYLTLLIRTTSGSSSPFVHLYLYLPSVVFMIARKRHWAEGLTIVGVMVSFGINYGDPSPWPAWKSFHDGSWFWAFECGFLFALLILLKIVNYRMEKIPAEQ